ncbi:hypothetical protein [Yoonia sp.]|uniref:hypothetical protein n=1 Tax=Yoonia sp. TaxID=2212373 RepID=UPI00391945F5
MSGKTTGFRVYLTDDQRSQAEAGQKAAGYKTLSAYMRDCALSGAPVHLLTIAREMGKLGQIANDILTAGDAATGTGGLYGSDARKAARRIIKACDAVTAALRVD